MSGVTPPATAASPSAGVSSYKADLPGLYGGTRNHASCDAEKLVNFLETHQAKAAAWASVLGIAPSQIRSYVATLTPVILRTDTRVTNHGYVNGVANPIQSVLEAGTAVFVDKYGRPVVKCYCGNPLTPPVLYAAPRYVGPEWTDFSTTHITIIFKAVKIIYIFVIYDPFTGKLFRRIAGTWTPRSDGPYLTESTRSKTSPLQPSPTPQPSAPGGGNTGGGTTGGGNTGSGNTGGGTTGGGNTGGGNTGGGTTGGGNTGSGNTGRGTTGGGP